MIGWCTENGTSTPKKGAFSQAFISCGKISSGLNQIQYKCLTSKSCKLNACLITGSAWYKKLQPGK